jgi:hypothetical protein
LKTLSALPRRAMLLTLSEEPSWKKSKIASDEPRLDIP